MERVAQKRTRETDRRWLAFQCSKEIWGSGLAPLDKGIFLGPAEQLIAAFPKMLFPFLVIFPGMIALVAAPLSADRPQAASPAGSEIGPTPCPPASRSTCG